jgi:hypothetical protein
LHTSGRSGEPKIAHRLSSVSCAHRTPAGFPSGIPGIGEEIDRAMQHAPHPTRQSNLTGEEGDAIEESFIKTEDHKGSRRPPIPPTPDS